MGSNYSEKACSDTLLPSGNAVNPSDMQVAHR